MVNSRKLSDALRDNWWQRKEDAERKAKARHRIYLRSQGRNADADFMLLTNHDRLSASFRRAFVTGYR